MLIGAFNSFSDYCQKADEDPNRSNAINHSVNKNFSNQTNGDMMFNSSVISPMKKHSAPGGGAPYQNGLSLANDHHHQMPNNESESSCFSTTSMSYFTSPELPVCWSNSNSCSLNGNVKNGFAQHNYANNNNNGPHLRSLTPPPLFESSLNNHRNPEGSNGAGSLFFSADSNKPADRNAIGSNRAGLSAVGAPEVSLAAKQNPSRVSSLGCSEFGGLGRDLLCHSLSETSGDSFFGFSSAHLPFYSKPAVSFNYSSQSTPTKGILQ